MKWAEACLNYLTSGRAHSTLSLVITYGGGLGGNSTTYTQVMCLATQANTHTALGAVLIKRSGDRVIDVRFNGLKCPRCGYEVKIRGFIGKYGNLYRRFI